MTDEDEVASMMARIIGGEPVSEGEVMALAGAQLGPRTGDAWHLLCHWVADSDIPAKDPDYRAGQLQQIRACLAELQRG